MLPCSWHGWGYAGLHSVHIMHGTHLLNKFPQHHTSLMQLVLAASVSLLVYIPASLCARCLHQHTSSVQIMWAVNTSELACISTSGTQLQAASSRVGTDSAGPRSCDQLAPVATWWLLWQCYQAAHAVHSVAVILLLLFR